VTLTVPFALLEQVAAVELAVAVTEEEEVMVAEEVPEHPAASVTVTV
jgi:hypothetical protein